MSNQRKSCRRKRLVQPIARNRRNRVTLLFRLRTTNEVLLGVTRRICLINRAILSLSPIRRCVLESCCFSSIDLCDVIAKIYLDDYVDSTTIPQLIQLSTRVKRERERSAAKYLSICDATRKLLMAQVRGEDASSSDRHWFFRFQLRDLRTKRDNNRVNGGKAKCTSSVSLRINLPSKIEIAFARRSLFITTLYFYTVQLLIIASLLDRAFWYFLARDRVSFARMSSNLYDRVQDKSRYILLSLVSYRSLSLFLSLTDVFFLGLRRWIICEILNIKI